MHECQVFDHRCVSASSGLHAVTHVPPGLEQLLPQLFDQTEVKPEMVGAKRQQYRMTAVHLTSG
jgi:hypothetical protein